MIRFYGIMLIVLDCYVFQLRNIYKTWEVLMFKEVIEHGKKEQ